MRLAEVLAEVRLSAGAIAVQLDAALSGGVIDSQPRFLGDKVYVGGKGALRELPGSGGRTLASILETLRDRDDRIDVKLPVRADLQRYLEADVRLSAIARELDQLEAADASGESEAAAAFAARRAGLLAERTALRDAQRAALGVSPSAIVGEVLRQTVGSAVGGLASLFQSKRPPLGAVEVRFEPGAATLTDLDLKRIRGIATALRAEPWTGFVIRGAASAPRDGANPEELRELAESRALAVREAFVTAGAAGAQVLVGRPMPFDTTRPDRGARLEPVR